MSSLSYVYCEILVGLTLICSGIIWVINRNIREKVINGMRDFMYSAGIRDQIDFCLNEKVNRDDLLMDVYQRGNLAFGESYMKGDWDSPDLFELFKKILKQKSYSKYKYGSYSSNFFSRQTTSQEMINK